MKKTPVWYPYQASCPSRAVLARIADKWTVLVVGRLAEGTKRFGELRRDLGGVSQKMLTQTLRALEEDGLVTRRVHASVPPKVEYSLTTLGRTLIDLLDRVRRWAEEHTDAVLAVHAKRRPRAGTTATTLDR